MDLIAGLDMLGKKKNLFSLPGFQTYIVQPVG